MMSVNSLRYGRQSCTFGQGQQVGSTNNEIQSPEASGSDRFTTTPSASQPEPPIGQTTPTSGDQEGQMITSSKTSTTRLPGSNAGVSFQHNESAQPTVGQLLASRGISMNDLRQAVQRTGNPVTAVQQLLGGDTTGRLNTTA